MAVFDGKVVLITGAARGLGREYAGFFADDGAGVVVTDVDEAGAEETAAALVKDGARAIAARLDVTDLASAEAAVATAVDALGGVDFLVNNAGIWGDYENQGALHQDLDKWRVALDVMLTGPLVCAKAAVPAMIARGGGRIVNISSIGSWLPGSGVRGGEARPPRPHLPAGRRARRPWHHGERRRARRSATRPRSARCPTSSSTC